MIFFCTGRFFTCFKTRRFSGLTYRFKGLDKTESFLQCTTVFLYLLIHFKARDFILLFLTPLRAKACLWTTEDSPAPVKDPFCCEDLSAWLCGQGPSRQSYLTANLVKQNPLKIRASLSPLALPLSLLALFKVC